MIGRLPLMSFVCVVQLMELQSRFGTDERFRMDSRFLEEDKDKEEESGEALAVGGGGKVGWRCSLVRTVMKKGRCFPDNDSEVRCVYRANCR